MIKDINNCIQYIPKDLKISELNWKFLNYAVLEGDNALLHGPHGTGKTRTILAIKDAYPDRQFFNIPMGSTQDARSTFIGNTHYDKEKGTFVVPSYFVKGIQTPNAIILFDELTRLSEDAEKILMSVTDELQRFLRIDEDPHTPVINVAPKVSFLATANIGHEYTSTRELDEAFKDRFIFLEMGILNKEQELDLNLQKFENIDKNLIKRIVEIATFTREDYLDGEMNNFINTRQVGKFLKFISSGFDFNEVINSFIKNRFEEEDFIKLNQFIEKYGKN